MAVRRRGGVVGVDAGINMEDSVEFFFGFFGAVGADRATPLHPQGN